MRISSPTDDRRPALRFALLAALLATAASQAAEAVCPLDENFDAYPPSTSLHGLGGWKGLNDDPFFTAFTSQFPDPANSLPQSVVIEGDSDLVHEQGGCSGLLLFSAWHYLETPYAGGSGSELQLLNTYSDGGLQLASASIRFDPGDGMAKVLHGDGMNSIQLPFDNDRWVKIQQVIDLDDDWTRIYYDDQLVTEYPWTGGVFGTGGGASDVAGVRLSANGSASTSFDDLRLDPIPPLLDDFEPYANGSDLHGQGGWKGFDGNPSAGAPASQAQAHGGLQSVEIAGTSNLVHEASTPLDGVYSLSVWQYIPSGFSSAGSIEPEQGSIYRIFDTYSDGGAQSRAVELRADSSSGNLEVFSGTGSITVDVPYETDRWVKIQVIVDLDDDWTRIYYDDQLVTEYPWTGGVLGGGGGNLDIGAVDLFANGSSGIFYDDLLLDRGCGVGRASDADGDGRSLGQELVDGTNPCIAEPTVPALPWAGAIVLAFALLGAARPSRG